MIVLPVTCPIFIGRRDELAALNDARRALAKSQGSFVLIGGEAGIGKSRLTAQLLRQAGDRRVRNVALAECVVGSAEPLRPIRAVVETLLVGGKPPHLSGAAERVLRYVAPQPAAAFEAPSGARLDRADSFAGLVDLLVAFAEKRATIVVIEDMHWADPSTLEFLAYLAPRVAKTRLLVIATYRSDRLEANASLLRAISRVERVPTVRRIALEPLDGDDLRRFIDAAVDGRAALSAATLDDIAVRSEGNPFYAEELLKGALAFGTSGTARLPISISGAIRERLGRFDDGERRVLSFAAVLGYRFDPVVLAAVMTCDVEQLLVTLQRARDAYVLVEDADDRSLLRFRHALTRQVIYDELLAFDVRRLHQRVLETLEARGDASVFLLAEHAAGAGDDARTMTYGERAAEAAFAVGGFAEAVTNFERVLALAGEADRVRILERLGNIETCAGQERRAVERWEEAFALRVARREYAEALRLRMHVVCQRYNLDELAGSDEAALRFGDEYAAHLTAGQRNSLLVLIARLKGNLGEFAAVADLLERVEEPAAIAGAELQSFLDAKLTLAAYYGRVAEWRRVAAAFVALPPLNSSPAIQAINDAANLNSVVASGLFLGTHAEVESASVRASTFAKEFALPNLSTANEALEAARLFNAGRVTAARATYERCLGRDVNAPVRQTLAMTAPLLAVALAEDALVERTIDNDCIAHQRESRRRYPGNPYCRLVLGGYGTWLATLGRIDEAQMFLEEALGTLDYPSPAFAGIVTSALRHLGPAGVPSLDAFSNARLSADDAVGHATAALATAAAMLRDRRRNQGDVAAAGHAAGEEYERAGYPLFAAHAYHVTGAFARAKELYARCEATAYLDSACVDAATRANAETRRPRSELSERERQVAEFIVLGLTNGAIAERLSVSPKTVEKHLGSIFDKLGVRTRTQVAARVAGRRFDDARAH